MFQFIKRLITNNRVARHEHKIVKSAFNNDPKDLIAYLNEGPRFDRINCVRWISPGGTITVLKDICGYEVHILGGPLVDCNPAYYGWKRETGRRVFAAIIECIPGSSLYTKQELV